MPLLLYVLVLLPTLVLIGQTKPTVKSGMLMVVVRGSLVIHVLCTVATKVDVNDNLDVLTKLQAVLVSEMSLLVILIAVVRGLIPLNRVLVLMSEHVQVRHDVLQAMIIVIITLMEAEMGQLV